MCESQAEDEERAAPERHRHSLQGLDSLSFGLRKHDNLFMPRSCANRSSMLLITSNYLSLIWIKKRETNDKSNHSGKDEEALYGLLTTDSCHFVFF